MPHAFHQVTRIAGNAARFGWYYGLNRLLDARFAAPAGAKGYRPARPVPTRQELMTELARLLLADARAVGDGVNPPSDEDELPLAQYIGRLRRMIDDLPHTIARRGSGVTDTARGLDPAPAGAPLPDYFTQDFHFQTGGYLSEESARLYDLQVETLFYGTANLMRRALLRPIAEHIHGRDQRTLSLLDTACGTGRLLRQIRLAFPALPLIGADLSQPYLDEARRHLGALRPATLVAANAEALPFARESQDIVTCVFLFHELPGEVRRTVAAEIARVLKPGGILVFMDSLQLGDRPGWDGLLEAFPHRFHEPYYADYIGGDLDGLFAAAGLAPVSATPVFLSKMMVRRKA